MMLVGISLLVVALDQLTKFLVLHTLYPHESIMLLPDLLYFTYIQNSGVAFGFLSNLGPVIRIPFFIAVTLAATSIVYAYQKLIPEEKLLTRVALGLVLGGAMGNLADRLFYGQVIDFIEVRNLSFPYIFNLADSCITIGLLLLFAEFIWGTRRKQAA